MKHYKKVIWSDDKTMIAEVNWNHPDWPRFGKQKKYSIFNQAEDGHWLDSAKSDSVEELKEYLLRVKERAGL